MDTARDKFTLEFIEAEELWNMATVDSQRYVCRGCATQVFPASYDKKRNKKRPYFSLGPVNKHATDCNVDGDESIVKRGKKERVGSPEGFPLPFPSKLTITDDREVEQGGADDAGSEHGGTRSRGRSGGGTVPNRYHGHTVKTIRPACRAFLNFPYDREYLPLAIPDVPGNTYARVFLFLGSKAPRHFEEAKHLYYAAIRWTAEPVVTDTSCEVTLNAGEWDDTKKRYRNLARLCIDWSGWSQSRKDSFLKEFEATRVEAAEEAKADSEIKGWIFFVGTQDSADPSLFRLDDYRLVCCLAGKMIWPR